MFGIIVGVLAGLTALVMVPLVTAVMAVLSPVLSFYQSIGGMAERAITAWGSANNETRSDRDAKIIRLPDGSGDVEGSRQAA
jgi:hypothetical protein